MAAYPERGGNWSVDETDLLLKLWGDPRIQQEMVTTIRNLDIYNNISEKMRQQRPECHRTGLQCRYRVKRLKRDFLRAKAEDRPRSFIFYQQMEDILTKRARAAEWLQKTKGHGKKKKRARKVSNSSATVGPVDVSEIKIEIDDAEEYGYGEGREQEMPVTYTVMASSSYSEKEKDRTDDEDDVDDDSEAALDGVGMDTKDTDEDCSLPVRFYETDCDGAEAEVPSSGDQQDTAPAPPSSSPAQAVQADDTSTMPAAVVGSSGDIDQCDDASPFPFVIKSVFHVGESELDTTEADGTRGSDKTSVTDNNLNCEEQSNKILTHDLLSSEDSCTSQESDSSKRVDTGEELDRHVITPKTTEPGEGNSEADSNRVTYHASGVRSSEEFGKDSQITGALAKVVSQVDKDLQILAEWTLKEVKSEKKLDSDTETTPDVLSSTSSLAVDKPVAANARPLGDPSKCIMTEDVSNILPTKNAEKSSARFWISNEAGHVGKFIPIPDNDPEPTAQDKSSEGLSASSASRNVSAKPVPAPLITLLPSSGEKTLPRRAVSLLSSKTSSRTPTPAVIVRKVSTTSASLSETSMSIVSTTAAPSAPVFTKRPGVTSSSSSVIFNPPIKVIRRSQATSLLQSKSAGAKIICLTPFSSQTTTTTSSYRSTSTPSVSRQPLTFTTLSSMDPVPKRMKLSPEPSAPPTSKRTIIISPCQTSSSGHPPSDVKMVPVSMETRKGLIEQLERKGINTTKLANRIHVAVSSEEQRGTKRPHEEFAGKSDITRIKTERSASDTSLIGFPKVLIEKSQIEDKSTTPWPPPAKIRILRCMASAATSPNPVTTVNSSVKVLDIQDERAADSTAATADPPLVLHSAGATKVASASTATTPSFPSSLIPVVSSVTTSAGRHAHTYTVSAASTEPSTAGDTSTDTSYQSLTRKDEEILFEHFLTQSSLSEENREWMLQTLRSRTDSEQSHTLDRPGSPLGSAVEVTNLVVNDGSVKTDKQTGTFKVKAGMAQMTKGGIIMDVTTPEEARVAEEAGACAVMALERVPADIRRQGGVARMTDPKKIKEIIAAVTIPVMAKCRIGHFAEAQILESLGVDMVDESEVLTPADEEHHVDKHTFTVPFVCGARDLGEALRRISEGAAMIRTKGEAGTGDVVEAVRHARTINRQIRTAKTLDHTELYEYAKELRVPYDLLKKTAELGRLPVVNFAAGGLATPADVSLLMQLDVDGVFVGSGIFKSADPPSRARAMAQAVTHYKDPKILADLSENLGEAMFGNPVTQQMRQAADAPGNKQQEKLWNATLAMEKFKVSA